jgi:cutinase
MKAFTSLLALSGMLSAATAAPVVADDSFPLAALEKYYAAKFSEFEYTGLEKRQYTGDTYNQLIDGTACRAVTLIYARGTTQAGNVGDPAAVGPLFFNNLAGLIGASNLAVQGIDYAANIFGFLAGGDSDGSQKMAELVATVSNSSII